MYQMCRWSGVRIFPANGEQKHLTDADVELDPGVHDRDPSDIDLVGPTVNAGVSTYIDHY